MTDTLLIRHAHTAAVGRWLAGRAAGLGLDARGVPEARALAGALREEPLAAVYTSPLQRALETAAMVAAPHGLEPLVEHALEEVDYGEWTGLSFAELERRPAWHAYHAARSSTRIPGGELLLEVQARGLGAVQRLAAGHAGASIAIVSHAEVLRCVLAACLGVPLDLALRLEILPASVSRVRWQDRGPLVLSLNEPLLLDHRAGAGDRSAALPNPA